MKAPSRWRSRVERRLLERALRAAFFALGVGAPTLAHAQPGGATQVSLVQPENLEVERLLAEASSSDAPQAALKRIFALWDQADPDAVERALLQAESKVPTKSGAKSYASLLVAEARIRRGDRAAAAQRVSKLGFVTSWAFVGPFDDEGRIGIGTAYQPEAELLGPIVLGRAFDGKPRTVRWRVAPSEGAAVFDFGDYVRPREETCGYATSFVRTARAAARDACGWVGWAGAFKLWWNGELVTSDTAHRGFDYDRVAGAVRVEPGWNRVTVKVCATGSPKFALRLADDRGEPLSFEAKNDPAISEERRAKSPLPKSTSVKGPLTLLSERASAERASAKDLEALARYLHVTGGNPIGEHRPRDLAIRAAELTPTWERALFAAELVEDRNQATRWAERAEALAEGDARGEIQVLLARAALHRSSVNFRDATPLYEEVLRRAPDNLVATLGRVELFIQAGMPRTALGILERALDRFPRRVALLKVHAAQLRAVGRDSEADAVDARWFAFRSDDASFLSKEVDRAIARDDLAAAERWIERLLFAEPDAAFGRLLAARAFRSMGQGAKAKAALEAALELAPEETGAMRVLGDMAAEAGDRATQIRYLQRILQQNPQDKATRDYLATLAPDKPRADEALAWDAAQIAERAKSTFGKGGRMRTLRKLSVTTVFENGLANRFYQVVFQPLTEEAAAEARQYFTAFEGSRQSIDLRLAKVYRADGSVAEALESGEGAANDPSIAMYTSTRTFFVSFPRLSPGDVVEVRYRIDDVTVKNDVKDAFYDVEVLQERDPILEAEYVLVAPKSKPLTTFVSKLPGSFETTESGDQTTRKFVVKELAGVPPEPAQAPGSEIAGQIHVSTFKTWEEIGAFYWNLSKDMLDVDEEVRKVTQEIAKAHKDEAARVRAVYRFATNLRYVALEFGIEGIKPRRCALTLARGWGDCKDKATVIVTMLRELGIPSTIVLVRTQQRGDLPAGAPPSLGVFDHAIAYVPSLDLYLDGTAEGSGSTELPEMDRGAVALQINEGRAKLVRLPNPGPDASPHERRFELTFAADGTATFVAEKTVSGVNAPRWRARYASAGTRKERATKDFSGFFGPVEPSTVTVRDADDVERPFQIAVKGKASAVARREGEAWSVTVASSLELGRGLVAPSSRQTELVIGALSESHERRTFKLPAGAKVDRMPRATKLSTAYGDLSIEATQEGGRVVVESRLSIKKSRIQPAEYEAFRDFCLKADEALSQRLVWRP
jgi:tetratricopeptide (TPR) repeat protein